MSGSQQKTNLTAKLAIVAIMLAVVLLAWQAYRYFGPRPEYPPPVQARNEQVSEWIRSLAQKSGGDINRLTPQERAQLEVLTRGNGEIALRAALSQK
jgi:cytoskeletal protein RodZ